MNARSLTAVFLAMSFLAVAQAQTGSGFPTLPPVPKTGQLVDDPASTHFTFVAAGDNRPQGPNDPQPQTLSQILQDTKQFKPAFMLWSGDTIAGFRVLGKPMNKDKLTGMYDEFSRSPPGLAYRFSILRETMRWTAWTKPTGERWKRRTLKCKSFTSK